MDERQPFNVDIRSISFDIPMSIERRIGAAIIAFSRFEHNAEITIWHFLSLDGDRAKLVTGKLDTSRKLQLLKELLQLERFSHPFWERFWKGVSLCVELRNKISHGVRRSAVHRIHKIENRAQFSGCRGYSSAPFACS